MNEDKKFNIESKDEELLEVFALWKKESQTFHDEMLPKQKLAEQYYFGDQTDKGLIPAYQSNTVENRVFEAVETITPIVTAAAHHFLVMPGGDNEISVEKANKLGKVLERKYQTMEMQRKLEDAVRYLLVMRFGVMKWCWDEVLDDVDVKVIDPRLILIPRMNLDPHELPYKMEIQDYTYDEMENYFPKIDLSEMTSEREIDTGERKSNAKLYRVYEVWTPEMVAWISCGKVLDKKANPYWDFEGKEKKYVNTKAKGLVIEKELVFKNHLDRPTDPFVFLTTYRLGDSPIPPASLVEISMPLQDAINTQKRQIIDNLRRTGNNQVYVDDDAMTQEEAENITNEVGLIIRGAGVASQNKVRREQGTPLPNGHFDNLQHSEMVFDNIMGTHGSTRGNANAGTLGQDLMSRQQDYTRIDLITRVVNRAVARIANGLVQLMRMYYDETKVIKILGEDSAVEFIRMNSDDIEDHIEIEVRSGQALPMDKVALRTEAVQLWQLGALDPVTLFQRLDFVNPEKSATMLQAWKTGQLTQDTMAKAQLSMMESNMALQQRMQEAKMGLDTEGKKSEMGLKTKQAESDIKVNEEVRRRGVETAANVIQRATANLGGGAPSLPKTPKLAGQKQSK